MSKKYQDVETEAMNVVSEPLLAYNIQHNYRAPLAKEPVKFDCDMTPDELYHVIEQEIDYIYANN